MSRVTETMLVLAKRLGDPFEFLDLLEEFLLLFGEVLALVGSALGFPGFLAPGSTED